MLEISYLLKQKTNKFRRKKHLLALKGKRRSCKKLCGTEQMR
jgi:hypothetical protein